MSIDVPAADVVAVAVPQSPVSDFPAGGSRRRPPVGAPVAAADDGVVSPARRDPADTGPAVVATPGGPALISNDGAGRAEDIGTHPDALPAGPGTRADVQHTVEVLTELSGTGSEAWRVEVHAELVAFAAQVMMLLDRKPAGDPAETLAEVAAALSGLDSVLGWAR